MKLTQLFEKTKKKKQILICGTSFIVEDIFGKLASLSAGLDWGSYIINDKTKEVINIKGTHTEFAFEHPEMFGIKDITKYPGYTNISKRNFDNDIVTKIVSSGFSRVSFSNSIHGMILNIQSATIETAVQALKVTLNDLGIRTKDVVELYLDIEHPHISKVLTQNQANIQKFVMTKELTEYEHNEYQKRWPLDNKATIMVDMPPQMFLDLTTTPTFIHNDELDRVKDRKKDIGQYQQMMDAGEIRVHPFLLVDEETGRITSHEGRARALAAIDAGRKLYRVAVVVYPPSRQLSLKDVPDVWIGQYDRNVKVNFKQCIDNGIIKVLDDNVQKQYQRNESVVVEGRDAPLYHATTIQELAGIFLFDELSARTLHSVGSKGTQGVSLTRSLSFAKRWKRHSKYVILELDQAKLAQNFKIIPIDYYQTSAKGGYSTQEYREFNKERRKGEYAEAEEFVVGPIGNIHNFIKQILIPKQTINAIKDVLLPEVEIIVKARIRHQKVTGQPIKKDDSIYQLYNFYKGLPDNPKVKLIEGAEINEGRDAPLYHATSIDSAFSILKSNSLHDKSLHTPNIRVKKEDGEVKVIPGAAIKGVSLSRDFNFAKRWANSNAAASDELSMSSHAIFVLDQAKLAQDYKILPIDYFQTTAQDEFGPNGMIDADRLRRRHDYAEAEEFVIGPISNLNKYLKFIIIDPSAKERLTGMLNITDKTLQSKVRSILDNPKLRVMDLRKHRL